LDGWFDEAGELTGGWVIGDREPYSPDRDDAHAAAIYSLLEDEIVPMYYNNREQGVPIEWMARVKQSLAYVSTNFNCQRMVEEYTSQLYQPAHQGFIETSRGHFAKARAHSAWLRSMNEKWPRIAIVDYDVASNGSAVLSGSPVPLRATVDLAGLEPADVRVEAVVGHVGAEGELIDMQVLALAPLEQSGTKVVFGRDFTPLATGRLGCSVRVSPNHFDDPLNRPCNAPLKWADEPTA